MKSFILALSTASLLACLTQSVSAAGMYGNQFGVHNQNLNFGAGNVQASRAFGQAQANNAPLVQEVAAIRTAHHRGHSYPAYQLPYGYYGYGGYGNGYSSNRYRTYGNPAASFAPAGAFGFGPGAIFGW